ncbi:hypothetical protein BDK51DRAFT_38077 [Blyttiomyces helicus]|uniref:Uncharacterized protein n=1 Tax=Blyttiomyces helicus TaxID=388810 RepID=A0A4P9WDT9_9FUNG|nr:hypothetical protein BDK51DRAFT_38077 [Blyttiomyces helicus]|eukprot:RKO90734.1 hypothetical protein BDK51DRAFT_38077 [Blyttiomyces helicus]
MARSAPASLPPQRGTSTSPTAGAPSAAPNKRLYGTACALRAAGPPLIAPVKEAPSTWGFLVTVRPQLTTQDCKKPTLSTTTTPATSPAPCEDQDTPALSLAPPQMVDSPYMSAVQSGYRPNERSAPAPHCRPTLSALLSPLAPRAHNWHTIDILPDSGSLAVLMHVHLANPLDLGCGPDHTLLSWANGTLCPAQDIVSPHLKMLRGNSEIVLMALMVEPPNGVLLSMQWFEWRHAPIMFTASWLCLHARLGLKRSTLHKPLQSQASTTSLSEFTLGPPPAAPRIISVSPKIPSQAFGLFEQLAPPSPLLAKAGSKYLDANQRLLNKFVEKTHHDVVIDSVSTDLKG